VQQYWWVVASAAVVGLAVGAVWQGVALAPGWAAIGWLALTAIGGQVLGWLLVALASPVLPSTVSAALLLLTPVGALALSSETDAAMLRTREAAAATRAAPLIALQATGLRPHDWLSAAQAQRDAAPVDEGVNLQMDECRLRRRRICQKPDVRG
jgi:hypothetical protein